MLEYSENPLIVVPFATNTICFRFGTERILSDEVVFLLPFKGIESDKGCCAFTNEVHKMRITTNKELHLNEKEEKLKKFLTISVDL